MNFEYQKPRYQLIINRWRDVLLVAVAIAPLLMLFGHWKQHLVSRIDEISLWQAIAVAIAATSVGAMLGIGRLVGFFKPLRSLCWPSYWNSILAAVGISMVAISSSKRFKEEFHVLHETSIDFHRTGVACLLMVLLLPAVGLLQLWVEGKRSSSIHNEPTKSVENGREKEPSTSLLSRDTEALRAWVNSDAPILSKNQDLFGHTAIASRVASRLLSAEPPSQSILGHLGAGKSSLFNLVQQEISRESRSKIRIVPISLWPFREPVAAVEGIISIIVRSLERDVSAFVLQRIATEYGEAISKTGNSSQIVLSLLNRSRTPWEVLSSVNDIANSIGIHIVLWVEDLERFAAETLPDANEKSDSETRLSPIRSLLHAFEQFSRFTIVSVTTSLLYRFDIEKISKYIERIPLLSSENVAIPLGVFRKEWLKCEYLDPESAANRSSIWGADSFDFLTSISQPESIVRYVEAVTILIKSPRTLKRVLRRCDEAWKVLCGEVDLDEMIVVLSLRESSPRAFALLEERVVRLQYYHNHQEKSSVFEELGRAVDDLHLAARERQAIDYLFSFLFGKAKRMQSVSRCHHVNYWKRIVSQDCEGVSDQSVLRILLSDDDAAVVSLLEKEATGRAVFEFSSLVDTMRCIGLIGLAYAVPDGVHPEKPVSRLPPSFVSLWGVLLEKSKNEDIDLPLISAIEDCARLAIHGHPQLFVEIVMMYASSWERQGPLTSRGLSILQDRLRALFLSTFVVAPKLLSSFLSRAPLGALRVLILRTGDDRRGLLQSVRREVGSALLAAIAYGEDRTLSQIAELLMERMPLERRYIFNKALADDIWGDGNLLLSAVPHHLGWENLTEGAGRGLVMEAMRMRARCGFIGMVQEICDHPEVTPNCNEGKM